DLVMRNLRRQTCLFSDRDCFFDTRNHTGRFVAHVRYVDTAETRGNLSEFNNLLSGSKSPRDVEQPGTEAEGSILHALFDQCFHSGDLFSCCASIDVSNNGGANRTLADETADVDRLRQFIQACKERRDRHRRIAIGTFYKCRDALTDIVICSRDIEYPTS